MEEEEFRVLYEEMHALLLRVLRQVQALNVSAEHNRRAATMDAAAWYHQGERDAYGRLYMSLQDLEAQYYG
jgi:hypothetical protein